MNNDNNGSFWKWISALLATILLAGSPGIVYALRSPSPDQVNVIQERQQNVLQRLAVAENEIVALQNQVIDLVQQLRTLLERR